MPFFRQSPGATGRVHPIYLFAVLLLVGGPAHANTIEVDVGNDDLDASDGCGLREAVINANNDDQSGSGECAAGSGADRIEFTSASNGTILLDTGGELVISDDLDIVGNGVGTTVIDGNGDSRVFKGIDGASIHFESLTIRNGGGVVRGGGFLGDPDVSLEMLNVEVAGNTADGGSVSASGGGIYVGASTTLEGVTLRDNQAVSSGDSAIGGGLRLSNAGSGTPAPLTIRDSRIINNRAQSATIFAGGGGLRFQDGSLGSLVIEDSIIRGNQALNEGSTVGARGGGLEVPSAGSVTLERTEVSANKAEASGAPVEGGGIHIPVVDGSWTLVNVTVSNNLAKDNAGADVRGGGIYFSDFGETLELNNVTMANNTGETSSSTESGGLYIGSGTVQASNTLIADNTGDSPDCSGTIQSLGWTLLGDDTDCTLDTSSSAGGDQENVDPMLAALADNGGFGRTHALQSGSPAIDAGNPNPVQDGMPPACEPQDQRGESRPADGDNDGGAACDIGAFEGAAAPPSNGGGGGGGSATPASLLLLLLILVGTQRGYSRRYRIALRRAAAALGRRYVASRSSPASADRGGAAIEIAHRNVPAA